MTEKTIDTLAKLKEQKEELANTQALYNQYSERIGTAITAQKKLFRSLERLTNFKEPLMLLERTSGNTELYHNVKEKEFNVPDLPEGVEKKIILGRVYQKSFPYAGRDIKYYDCHEDWAFPHIWTKPNIYTGNHVEKIKDWYNEKQGANKLGINGVPLILEHANVNAEAMRDRERKVLVAWERFTSGAKAMNIKAWAKFVMFLAAGIALVVFAWNMFGPDPATAQTAITVAQNISTVGQGIVIGG